MNFQEFLRNQRPYVDPAQWAEEAAFILAQIMGDTSLEMDPKVRAGLQVLYARMPIALEEAAMATMNEYIDSMITSTDQYAEGLEEIDRLLEEVQNDDSGESS